VCIYARCFEVVSGTSAAYHLHFHVVCSPTGCLCPHGGSIRCSAAKPATPPPSPAAPPLPAAPSAPPPSPTRRPANTEWGPAEHDHNISASGERHLTQRTRVGKRVEGKGRFGCFPAWQRQTPLRGAPPGRGLLSFTLELNLSNSRTH